MIVLCGFAASNYYNKVKLALLEKAVPFEEKLQCLIDLPSCWPNHPWAKCRISRSTGRLCANRK
jgi:hypothetical protein